MSGSSLDGLDIVFAEFEETGGRWTYEIKAAECLAYENVLSAQLQSATHLNAYEYLLLDSSYGKYIGDRINQFISKHNLQHQVQLITSHGHTIFHAPKFGFTSQLGNGAAIAAVTEINVVSDLRILDVVLGGEGAPIVPVGERLLWKKFPFFLNLGGIANISFNKAETYIAFDVCPANRVLNMLAKQVEKEFDEGGTIAAGGSIETTLLTELNNLEYYQQSYPKSLSNSFGTEIIYPLIQSYNISVANALRTYTEHIIAQIVNAINLNDDKILFDKIQLFITGGGAFNNFLIERLETVLKSLNIEIIVPDKQLVKYKEALVMALLGVLRWREENTVFHSVTGAIRSSIGGAVWIGLEA